MSCRLQLGLKLKFIKKGVLTAKPNSMPAITFDINTMTKLGTRSFRVAAPETWNSTTTSPFTNHQPRSVPNWTQIPPVQVRLHVTLPPRTIDE